MLIDTHAAVRNLENAGMNTAQAEAVVTAIAQADERVATKADIERLDERVNSLRSEMRWMFGFIAVFILAMAGRLFGVL